MAKMLMKNVYIGLKDRRNFDKIAVSVQKKMWKNTEVMDMPNIPDKRQAFISYGGNIDVQIAALLCDFLCDFFGYKTAVYCTASHDNRISVPYGDDFSASYMKNIGESNIFIPLLSENYMQSMTTLVEMGAAYALGKKFLPFLVSGCDYGKLQPLYNIRNNDMYAIDNCFGLRKALEEINLVLDHPNPISEEKCNNLIRSIKQLKSGYKTIISKQKQIKFVCNKLFSNKEEYKDFINELGKRKILDIGITNYTHEEVLECSLYFKDTKNVSDLMAFLDEKGFLENEYNFIEIEG